ncbi:MAG: radical SAM family heme chaperone HemW [Bacilli bacterium]|nr:radical SAM family heme chaperone HemW [Bacilli bacterium]
MKEIKSLYLHIPFCMQICSYCDFCKMFYNEKMVNDYLEELEKEITKNYQNDILKTIYIGGGTPSSLKDYQLDKLFFITDKFNIEKEYEFTFECNISDINKELLEKLKENKVNRISIGIETINEKFYELINRYNDKEDIKEKIKLTKKYFNNINIDLMYGFPNETLNDLINDLEFFKDLDVPHISIYSLILEENTKLYINNTKPLDEELESNMYYYIINYLKKLGYKHYEISNFSKEGYESKHNLTYWNNEEYYGFGLSSGGYVNNKRYTNTRSLNNYLKGNYKLEEEELDLQTKMENEMILGLRKMIGIKKDEFFLKYNFKIEDIFDIMNMVDKKLIEDREGYIRIPEDKLYLSNSILVNFIGGSNE